MIKFFRIQANGLPLLMVSVLVALLTKSYSWQDTSGTGWVDLIAVWGHRVSLDDNADSPLNHVSFQIEGNSPSTKTVVKLSCGATNLGVNLWSATVYSLGQTTSKGSKSLLLASFRGEKNPRFLVRRIEGDRTEIISIQDCESGIDGYANGSRRYVYENGSLSEGQPLATEQIPIEVGTMTSQAFSSGVSVISNSGPSVP